MDKKSDKTKKEKHEETQENPCAECETERDEWKSKYLRALADYDNLQKRERERGSAREQAATQGVLLRLLPFLDNLDKAEAFVQDDGLRMIRDQFAAVLKGEGLAELDVLGKPYDPQTAEAVEVIAGEADDEVVEVVQKGYAIHDRVIRPAMVKVSKKVTS